MLLTEDLWQIAKLRELLATELRPYRDKGVARIRLEGLNVEIPSEVAMPSGMELHELTTNAARLALCPTEAGVLT